MRKSFLVCVAVMTSSLFHPAPSLAQAPPAPALSLEAALREAEANNPEVIALRREADATTFAAAGQRALGAPMLEAQAWQWPVNAVNPWNTNMYMLMATQDIPGRGKRALRAAAAEKRSAVAGADVAVRVQQVLAEVKQQYAELYLARKSKEIYFRAIDLLNQSVDVTRISYASGLASQQDVLIATTEASRLRADLIMFDEQAALAVARLDTLLGRNPDTPIGPLDEPSEQPLTATAEHLQQTALDHQPELARVRAEIEQAAAELAVVRSDYKPDYSVQGGYMLTPRMTDAVMGKVAITWPRAPWSRKGVDARAGEATAQLDAKRAGLRAAENMVRLAVQDAYVRVRAAEQRAALVRTTILRQQRQLVEVSRVAYRTSTGTFANMLEQERAVLGAELEYHRALSDARQATADLERAVGTEVQP